MSSARAALRPPPSVLDVRLPRDLLGPRDRPPPRRQRPSRRGLRLPARGRSGRRLQRPVQRRRAGAKSARSTRRTSPTTRRWTGALRARAAGYRNYWQPYSRVWHGGRRARRRWARRALARARSRPGRSSPPPCRCSWNPCGRISAPATRCASSACTRNLAPHDLLRASPACTRCRSSFWPRSCARRRPEDRRLELRRALSLYCAQPGWRRRAAAGVGADQAAAPARRRSSGVAARCPQRAAEGRLAQVREQVRGLWDGDLRSPAAARAARAAMTGADRRSDDGRGDHHRRAQLEPADDTLALPGEPSRADLGGATVAGRRQRLARRIGRGGARRFPAVRVLALPENRGFAGGNNAGIRAALDAGAQGVLLLNNDTRVVARLPAAPALGVRSPIRAPRRCVAPSTASTGPRCSTSPMREVRFDQRDAVQLCGVNALPGHGFESRREVEVAVGCSVLIARRGAAQRRALR